MKNWHNTDELDDLLGSELDLDLAWSEFKKDKKKTRRFPIWWCFGFWSILLLGSIWYFGHFVSLKIDRKETATNLLHPSATVPTFENAKDIVQEVLSTSSLPADTSHFLKASQNVSQNYQEESLASSLPINTSHFSEALQNASQNHQEKSSTSLHSRDAIHFSRTAQNTFENYSSLQINEAQVINSSPPISKISSKVNLAHPIESINTLAFYLPIQPLAIVPPSKKIISTPTTKKWSIGINYTFAAADRSLAGGEAAYNQKRQEEQFLETNQFEFVFARTLTPFFSIQTGLRTTQYRSKIEETIQTITSPVFYENVVTETQTRNNLTQEILGTAEGGQLTINRFTRFQQYQMLSIPIRFGVHIPLAPHWQLTANTGIAVGIWGQAKGLTFSSALPDGMYTPLSQLAYRKVGLLEGMGQLSVERSFGNTSLSLGVQGTIDLNSRLKQSASGVDKFRSYGVQVGLRRNF